MEHSYEITLDDWVAFNTYHNRHSPLVRRRLIHWTIGLVLIGAVMVVLIKDPMIVLTVVIFLLLFLGMLWHSFCVGNPKTVRKCIQEGKNQHVFGQHTIYLSKEGIRSVSEVSESKFSWKGIEKIAVADDYIYIYIGSFQAFIIPLRDFENQETAQIFLDQISQFYQPEEPLQLSRVGRYSKKTFDAYEHTAQLGSGFFKGLGYGLACITIGLLGVVFGGQLFPHQTRHSEQAGDYDAEIHLHKNLKILEHRLRRSKYDADILGTIKNEGSKLIHNASLEVELFDQQNEFVEKCMGYMEGALEAGQERNFEISCGGSEVKPLAEFERYSVTVVSSF